MTGETCPTVTVVMTRTYKYKVVCYSYRRHGQFGIINTVITNPSSTACLNWYLSKFQRSPWNGYATQKISKSQVKGGKSYVRSISSYERYNFNTVVILHGPTTR